MTQMQETNDPTVAHERWSRLAENFLRAWSYMTSDDDDDVESAVIAVLYSDVELSDQTNGDRPKCTRRGQLRVTKRMPAIAKLITGGKTASSHAAEALAKTVARAKSYMKLVGSTLSDAAYVARGRLKEELQRAATLLAPDKYINTNGDLTYEQAQEISEEGAEQLKELITERP